MRRFLVTLLSSVALVLALAVPAMAHPAVPSQSTCVIPAAAANGAHTAYANVSDNENGIAAHVLWVKSPHFCAP
jgi:hypothetical protein